MKTTTKLTEEKLNTFLEMYEQGKLDTEIAKVLEVSRATIANWRKKYDLPCKFEYNKISKIDYQKFEELFNLNYSDYKIAKILNMHPSSIYSHRKLHGFTRDKLQINSELNLTDIDISILLGTLLGDASLTISHNCINPKFTCTHGIKQKAYAEFKTILLEHLGAKCVYHKRKTIDQRTNIYYEDYTISITTNKAFLPIYNSLYINKKKIIPINLLKYFTEQSLALMFMDDGYKHSRSYSISTMCFEKENLKQFQIFLLNKFNLHTSIFKNKILYICARDKNLFEQLIKPYLCNSMLYKLSCHVTP